MSRSPESASDLAVDSQAPISSVRSVQSSEGAEYTVDGLRSRYVYALGQIEPRFPSLSIEKEFAQLVAQSDGTTMTDSEVFASTLRERENRYLARQLCWILSVEGIEAYVLAPRDEFDLDLLLETLRPSPRPTDVDVVIGAIGPIAPPEACNSVTLPTVRPAQIYSFDMDTLVSSVPHPEGVEDDHFVATAEELFGRVIQLADNVGAIDEHRAINYLSLRYPQIYHLAYEKFENNWSFSNVNVRPSRLSGGRAIVDVIFTYTDRATDVQEKFFVRVDVTEMFPFLVTKLMPYFDR